MDEHSSASPAALAAGQMNQTTRSPAVPVPFARPYWVAPGWLLAGAYPGEREPARCLEKTRGLAEHGVRSIFSLMEEVKYGHDGVPLAPYEAAVAEVAAENGIALEMRRFAIRDVRTPSVTLMRKILDAIDDEHAAGRPVYVHCWGGRGRTGTVVGCWLSRHGIATGEDALIAIERLRRSVPDREEASPQTDEQCDMVREWRETDGQG